MQRILSGMGAVLLATFFSSCLLTDAAGIRPIDSVSGAELKEMIGDQAALGWYFGCDTYLQSSFNSSCTELGGANAKSDIEGNSYPSFLTAYLMVKTLTPENADIDDGAFYKKASAEACAMNAFNQAFMWTNVYLTNEEVTGNGIVYTPASAYIPGVLLASNLAAGCDFERTGRVLELGPLSL